MLLLIFRTGLSEGVWLGHGSCGLSRLGKVHFGVEDRWQAVLCKIFWAAEDCLSML